MSVPRKFLIACFFNFSKFFFIYLGCAVRGFLSSCTGEAGRAVLSTSAMMASLAAEHGLKVRRLGRCSSRGLEHRLSSCGTWASLLHGTQDLPGPGIEPVSPALAPRF